ncbi:TRAP transporter small permease subunit, partial [Avibacterium avium]|uniref:TRAP transporter small permease subunit n=1 Tax=Avibacterium avium TaxID=751 RepID=UPI003BF854AD
MIERYENFINKLFLSLGSLLFIVIIIMTFIQVITRYLVNISFPWSEEFLRFCYTWMILFGILTTTQIQVPLLRIIIFEKFKYGWLLSSMLYLIMLFCLFIIIKGGIAL